MQNDFCPGGALAIGGADELVFVLNRYIAIFKDKKLPIFASRDWHPEKTTHFQELGGDWPRHCLQNTKGAEFHSGLNLPDDIIIISKGTGLNSAGYSALTGISSGGDKLFDLCRAKKVKELYVGGVATDFCVKYSVLDALKKGFKVKLLVDAIKGVDSKGPQEAQSKMLSQGAEKMTLNRATQIFKKISNQ